MQRGDASAVGLHFGELPGREPPQTRHLVLAAAPLELVEAAELTLVARDDDLAAALVRDLVLLAVVVHLAGAGYAKARLERARDVVDARVNYPAVGAGLPARHLRAPLEHDSAQLRPPPLELASDRQAEDACPHDHEIALRGRVGH